MDDRQSIREFVEQGSESAFLALVNRHLGMVRATALRQTRDAQLADDVSQTVFILFSRKARRLSSRVVLSGWLYRTTCFVAQRALRAEQRRRRREQEAFEMRDSTSMDETYRRLSPMLDDAMSKLRGTDRNAVLLRFIEQKPLREVGENLGLSEEAARKRVERSLDKLRGYFSRRGFAISAGGLSAALNTHGAEQVSAEIVRAVAGKVFSQSAASIGSLPELAREALAAQRVGRMALVAASVAVVTVAAFLGSNILHYKHRNLSASTASQENGAIAVSTAPTNSDSTNTASEFRNAIVFRALDAETGQPLSGARILAIEATFDKPQHLETNLFTDANGRCDIPLVYGGKDFFAVGVLKDGYEIRCAMLGGDQVPASYTLKVPPGTTIGGVVVDAEGKPVPGVAIAISYSGTGDYSEREFQRERIGFPDDSPLTLTDADGHWTFASGSTTNDSVSLSFSHQDFAIQSIGIKAGDPNLDELRSGQLKTMMSKGLTLAGVVTDEQQKPIANAKVSFRYFFASESAITTARDGSFKFEHLAAGANYLNVSADGFAPERVSMTLDSNTQPVTVALKTGNHLRLRVIDDDGEPVANARVVIEGWRGFNTLDWQGLTEADGMLDWNSAPGDDVNFSVSKTGYCFSRNHNLAADGAEHTITLHRTYTVSGEVIDHVTGKPISEFKAIPGTERLSLVHGTNGSYSLNIAEEGPLQIHIEADGYNTAASNPFGVPSSNVCYNAELERTDARHHAYGVITLPDHTPAGGVQVALCRKEKNITIGAGEFINTADSVITKTGDNGQFSFPFCEEPLCVVAVSQQGFGRAVLSSSNLAASIVLKPWGRVTGQLKLRHESSANRHVGIGGTLGRSYGEPTLAFSTRTDAQGNFVLDCAPPVPCKLYVYPTNGLGSFRYETPLDIKPGATTNVVIGADDVQIIGRFALANAAGAKPVVDWSRQILFARCAREQEQPTPPNNLTRGETRRWLEEYWNSDAGIARDAALRMATVDVHPDGSFTIENATPGTYQFTANVASKPVDPNDPGNFGRAASHPLGYLSQKIIIPDSTAPGATINAGKITIDTVNFN